MERQTALEDLENIYARNKNFQYKPDLNYDTLKISKDELKPKQESTKYNTESDTDYGVNNRNIGHSGKKGEQFIEMRSFLPSSSERMISSRYENPLNNMQRNMRIWMILNLIIAIISATYLSLNLFLVSVDMFNFAAPDFVLILMGQVVNMQDMLFLSNRLTAIIDAWGIVTYLLLIIIILREKRAHQQNDFSGKGYTGSNMIIMSAILFGVVYIVGTQYILYEVHKDEALSDMKMLIIYHVSKVAALVVNLFAFRMYKSAKYVFEDLMLEALESSDSLEDSSEMESI